MRTPFDSSIASEREDGGLGRTRRRGTFDLDARLALIQDTLTADIKSYNGKKWPSLTELIKVAPVTCHLSPFTFIVSHIDLWVAFSELTKQVCNLGRFVMSPNCTDYFALTDWLAPGVSFDSYIWRGSNGEIELERVPMACFSEILSAKCHGQATCGTSEERVLWTFGLPFCLSLLNVLQLDDYEHWRSHLIRFFASSWVSFSLCVSNWS